MAAAEGILVKELLTRSPLTQPGDLFDSGVVLTCTSPGSSLYRYGENFWKALDRRPNFINLTLNQSDDLAIGFLGTVSPSLRTGAYLVDGFLANAAPSLAFRNANATIRRARDRGGVVVVTSLDVPLRANSVNDVLVLHDDPFEYFSRDNYTASFPYRVFQRIRLLLASGVDHILTVSDTVRTELVRWGIGANVTRIYPPALSDFKLRTDRISARTTLGLPTNKRLVLSVGSNEKRKNLERLRQAIDPLKPSTSLVRVGPPISGAINLGAVGMRELVLLYGACDLLACPSLAEGFGSPVAESLTAGLPVVVSDIPVFREIVGKAGIFVDPYDVASIRRGISDVESIGEDLNRLGLEQSTRFDFEAFRSQVQSYVAGVGRER
jgi:glycosyltransferase involved in cell wall biosynthesis